jgi:hypothetical protein
MAKVLEPALQDYYNGICCNNTTPQGKITLTGGIADGLYTDLASAIAYIQGFTSATITDASLSGDTFKFTVPAGSDFSLVSDFMTNTTGIFIDNLGLVVIFGKNAFGGSTGNNVLGNCTFGNGSFANSTGNNILGDCIFRESFIGASGTNTITSILIMDLNDFFAQSYTGTMNITGNIGTTEGNDYPNFFLNASGATINVLASKQTSNSGGVEGDIALAQTNGANVNFNL